MLQKNILVSMDVKSPYTNILNSEGIAAAKRAFDKKSNKTETTKSLHIFSVDNNIEHFHS